MVELGTISIDDRFFDLLCQVEDVAWDVVKDPSVLNLLKLRVTLNRASGSPEGNWDDV